MGFQRKANQHAGILSQPCCGWLRGYRLWEMLKIAHDQKTELSGLPHYLYRSQGVLGPQLGTSGLAQSPLMLQMKEGVTPSGCVPTGDWFRGWDERGDKRGAGFLFSPVHLPWLCAGPRTFLEHSDE